ncbi:hypothetical protein K0M31_003862 [Melipona bicolor]|uniref:Ig-like domain-containing protein n=1 Tax=Melipona bicolor TaxID=60889 RepID=A0AA40KNV7_9HYME|nr:hypothetical protein K0M31_003862 [Melipona bicolor]
MSFPLKESESVSYLTVFMVRPMKGFYLMALPILSPGLTGLDWSLEALPTFVQRYQEREGEEKRRGSEEAKTGQSGAFAQNRAGSPALSSNVGKKTERRKEKVTLDRSEPAGVASSTQKSSKVAWIHVGRQMLLTIHKHVVVKIPRFSVSHDNQKTWLLHINNVQQDDRGYYMCQLNTNPMMSQVGFLQVVGEHVLIFFRRLKAPLRAVVVVLLAAGSKRLFSAGFNENSLHCDAVQSIKQTTNLDRVSPAFFSVCSQVPPNILDSLSTESTVAVRENQNITLTCKADGYPTPKLMWKREDGQSISINRHYKAIITAMKIDARNYFEILSSVHCTSTIIVTTLVKFRRILKDEFQNFQTPTNDGITERKLQNVNYNCEMSEEINDGARSIVGSKVAWVSTG